MGLMNTALNIGRNALLGYQSALQVIGSNISGAGNPDYARLTPQLESLATGGSATGLQPGAGVALTDIRRNIDHALENRLRLAVGDVRALSAEQAALAEIETYFDDVNGTGLASALNAFLGGFEDVAQHPEADRSLVVQRGVELAGQLQSLRLNLARIGEGLDEQIVRQVEAANELAARIAELNGRISIAEARGRSAANALRDQRDAALRRLGELLDVTVREQPNGVVNVYVGSEAIIDGGHSRGLTTAPRVVNGFKRSTVVFADSGAQIRPRGGQIAGLVRSRDEHAFARLEEIDTYARGLIQSVNRIHADGQGLRGLTSVTGTVRVTTPSAALDSVDAGLTSPVSHGAFHIVVSNGRPGGDTVHVVRIDLDSLGGPNATLESLAAQIDALDHLSAGVTPDNRLTITADAGYTFTFGHDGQNSRPDSSGVLAALGINTFFTGYSAADIAVHEDLVRDGNLLAASSRPLAGDAANAVRLAQLIEAKLPAMQNQTLPGRLAAIASDVAVRAAAVNAGLEAADGIRSALQAQRESLSGVSLDEEAIELVKYERAYQGAARYVSVVDQLAAELMSIIR